MQNGNARAKTAAEALHGLRRERDLRHEHNCLPAFLHHAGNSLQINLGLSASRYAIKQACASTLFHGLHDPIKRGLLLRRKRQRLPGCFHRRTERAAEDLLPFLFQNSLF